MEHVERIDRQLAYGGAILDIYADTMKLPTGDIEKWDFVHHRRGAAGIVPVLDDGRVLMIRQYRPAIDRMCLEIPAGARDSLDELTSICADRELLEETGYKAGKLDLLIQVKTVPAYCDEFIDIYLATDLKKVQDQDLDPAESIEIIPYELDELVSMIYSGQIQDGKTIAALMSYKVKLSEKN